MASGERKKRAKRVATLPWQASADAGPNNESVYECLPLFVPSIEWAQASWTNQFRTSQGQ